MIERSPIEQLGKEMEDRLAERQSVIDSLSDERDRMVLAMGEQVKRTNDMHAEYLARMTKSNMQLQKCINVLGTVVGSQTFLLSKATMATQLADNVLQITEDPATGSLTLKNIPKPPQDESESTPIGSGQTAADDQPEG